MHNIDGGLYQDLKVDVKYILSDEKFTDNIRDSTSDGKGMRNYPTLC